LSGLVHGLDTTLWSDAKFTGSLSIQLSCDWQILSLLKSANARPGSETEDSIDLRSVLPVVLQRFLYLSDVVPLHERGRHFANVGSGSERSRAWSGDPRCQH